MMIMKKIAVNYHKFVFYLAPAILAHNFDDDQFIILFMLSTFLHRIASSENQASPFGMTTFP